jgi:hypothetical protein
MKTPKLGREVMAAIGRELGLLYREIIAKGVPECFAAILRRLDEPVDGGLGPNGPPPDRVSRDAPQASGDGEGPNDGEAHESVGLIGFVRAMLAGCVPTGLVPA